MICQLQRHAVLLTQDAVNHMIIKDITETNFYSVSIIYKEGIETGIATFETKIPSQQSWDQNHLSIGRISAYDEDQMLGWASLSPVSSRCVYGGVAEVSVYVSQSSRGKGVGKLLLQNLINISEKMEFGHFNQAFFPKTKKALHYIKNATSE